VYNNDLEVFGIDFKKHFDAKTGRIQKAITNMLVEEIAETLGRLKIKTEPNQIFSKTDKLNVSACYAQNEMTIYALVSSSQFSLLYRVDLSGETIGINSIMFEQIITIKSAKCLLNVNDT
jgi:hypothetical protein